MRTVRSVRTVRGMTTHQAGRAGTFSRKMQLHSLLRATGWAAAAVCAGALALLLLTRHNYQGALFLAVAAAICGAASHHHVGRAGKQNRGAKSEQLVATALSKAGCFYVINNAVLPGVSGDADHVVLHPRGLCVVETKSGGGQVRINEDGKLVTGQGRVVPGDPINQVLVQAGALARLTDARVTAIVCVPWMKNKPFRSKGVWICGASQLAWVLRQVDGHLTSQTATQLANRIRR